MEFFREVDISEHHRYNLIVSQVVRAREAFVNQLIISNKSTTVT